MKKIEIIKTMTETYSLRGKKCLWAKINLDCGNETVNVMISSDYGEFNHYWGSCGMTPKEFLMQIDMYYGMGKLMGESSMYEPDFKSRLKSFKEMIIEARKYNDITKDKAREAWQEMLHIFDYCQNSDDIYYDRCYNSDAFEKILFDFDSIPNDTKIKRKVTEFWEDIWIPFIEYLKSEF